MAYGLWPIACSENEYGIVSVRAIRHTLLAPHDIALPFRVFRSVIVMLGGFGRLRGSGPH